MLPKATLFNRLFSMVYFEKTPPAFGASGSAYSRVIFATTAA
jgi:hypothetical protein